MTIQVLETAGNASTHSTNLTTPASSIQAGDVAVLAIASARSIPRAILSVSGLGATWTQIATTGSPGPRVAWFLGTNITNPSANTGATYDGGTPITGCALWLLRGVSAAPFVSAAITEGASTGALLGPPVNAQHGQIVLATGKASLNPVTLNSPALPSGWTRFLTTSGSMQAAYRVPAETESTAHRIDLTYPSTAVSASVGTLVLNAPIVIPPQPPANLRVLGVGDTYLDVDWDRPASGPAATSYDLRVNGGPVENLDTTTAEAPGTFTTLNDLASGTTYLVEVRTQTAQGPSAWVSVEGTTTTPPPPPPPPPVHGLRLEVGPVGAHVDLLSDSYSLTIRRGNATRGVTDNLEAATLVAVVEGLAANPLTVPQVRTGAPLRVSVGVDGVWEPLFTGELDRARLAYDTGRGKGEPDAYRVTLTATDPATPVLADHPHDTAIGGTLRQRVAHILDPAGIAYAVTDPSPDSPTPALPTGEKNAGGNLRLAVDTAHGVAFVDRHGVLRVVSDQSRPRTPDSSAADWHATDVDDGDEAAVHYYDVTPSLDTDNLVNVLEVEKLEEGTTVHVDTDSLDEWGPHADAVKVNDGVPETHADLWLASRRAPALLPEAVAFNVGNPWRPRREAHLRAGARLEVYDTISVRRAGVFETPAKMTVRNVTHTISASRRHGVKWLCVLALRPLEVLATRWDDVPPTLRWNELDPSMTWDDVVRWHPYL